MKITIPIKPLSVNNASIGRHIKTPEFKKYEIDVSLLLPFNKKSPLEGELFMKYTFYFKNYINSDVSNGIKLIEDILSKRGYLKDDRYVKAIYVQKERVEEYKDEKMIIDIVPFEDRYTLL